MLTSPTAGLGREGTTQEQTLSGLGEGIPCRDAAEQPQCPYHQGTKAHKMPQRTSTYTALGLVLSASFTSEKLAPCSWSGIEYGIDHADVNISKTKFPDEPSQINRQ